MELQNIISNKNGVDNHKRFATDEEINIIIEQYKKHEIITASFPVIDSSLKFRGSQVEKILSSVENAYLKAWVDFNKSLTGSGYDLFT